MASRFGIAFVISLGLLSCDTPGGQVDAGPPADDPVRTADPYARGLTDADFPRVKELAPGVYTYEQLRSAGDERFTTVSLFVVTTEGVVVADGQGSVEETRRLIDTIRGITDRPITHIVIGSDHGDHTAGNAVFPAAATVFVHPTSRAALESAAARANADAGTPSPPLPGELVEHERALVLGGREIRILFLGRAHTGGDLVVYLPAEKIMFMSETYLNRIFPAMRSAFPSEWVAMLRRARAMDVTTWVPGHGFVDSPDVLREELDACIVAMETVIAEATRLHDAGLPVDSAVARADFGDLETWTLRSSQGPIAIRRVYLELNGGLK